MKVRPAAVWFVLAVALTAGGMARAVDDMTPRSRSHTPNETIQKRVAMRLENLATKLELTDKQKTELRPILESEANELRSLRMNSAIAPEDQEVELRSIHERHRDQIRSVLTPEQQTRLDELRNEARAKLNEAGGQKRKGRVPVMPDND